MADKKDFGDLYRAVVPDLPLYHVPDLAPYRSPVDIKLQPNPLVVAAEANYASEFHKRLVKLINQFDATLDQSHEVGVRLVNFGQTVVFHLEDLGYWNTSLISFSGKTEANAPVELIQHVSQISILLMKVPRKDLSKPKRPIGFEQHPDPNKKDGQSEPAAE
jgi:hypothetical protein